MEWTMWRKDDATEHMANQPAMLDVRLDPGRPEDRLLTLAKPDGVGELDWLVRVSGRTVAELEARRHWLAVVTELDLGESWLYLSGLLPGDDDDPEPWFPDGPTLWFVVMLSTFVWVSGPFDHRPVPAEFPDPH